MAVTLRGTCRCGAVGFAVESHTPFPYQLCYCSICRKTAGGGGYAINLMGDAASLEVTGRDRLGVYRAEIADAEGHCERSEAQRHFCRDCGSALWLFDPRWSELVHPFASAIDSDLPVAQSRVHIMLRYKPGWVTPAFGADDQRFEEYPDQSIEDWHRSRGLWVD
jgi:hypothetical protein